MPSPPKYPTPSLLVPAALPPSGRRGIPKKRCGNPRRRAGNNVKPRRRSNPWIALSACGRGRRLLNNPEYDLAFDPPIEFKGDSFTGTVTSIQNPRLHTIYERVGASGKVTASVRGNRVSVNISGRLSDVQSRGSTNVSGEKSYTEFEKARRIGGKDG